MAISFDSYNRFSEWDTTDNNVNGNHVMGSGSNGIVVVFAVSQNVTLSSLTYGGNAMTSQAVLNSGSLHIYVRTYLNPTPGSNNVSFTVSGNDRKALVVASYHGVDQDNPVNTTNTGTGMNSANANLTTTAENAWLLAGGLVGSLVSSFTGVTERPSLSINTMNFGDSNAPVAAGANTLAINGTGSAYIASLALTPAASVARSLPLIYRVGGLALG